MSKLHYAGAKVEISNRGIIYKKSKEDKYVYLMTALEILEDIDNDYEKKPSYSHQIKHHALEEDHLHTVLEHYDNNMEECIIHECTIYREKIQHQIEHVKNLPHLTNLDKEVWIKNIEIMKEYTMQRAMNKMYYMHCIQDIVQVIQHKKIKVITTPFNKNFFHVLNTIKGAIITSKPSLDAKVIEEYDKDEHMMLRLTIRN